MFHQKERINTHFESKDTLVGCTRLGFIYIYKKGGDTFGLNKSTKFYCFSYLRTSAKRK
jgi:hypothetical protein